MDKRSAVVLAVGLVALLAAISLQVDFKRDIPEFRAEQVPTEVTESSVSDDPSGEPWGGPKDNKAEEAPNPDIVQDPDPMPTPKKYPAPDPHHSNPDVNSDPDPMPTPKEYQAPDPHPNSNPDVNSDPDPMPPAEIDPTPNKEDPSGHTLLIKKHGVISGSYTYFTKKSISSDEVSHLFVVHEENGDIYIEGDMPNQMREFLDDLSKYGDVVVQSSIMD